MNKKTNVLFNFFYTFKYYLIHPHKFLKECYHNVRAAWHRIDRGWAYTDVWNMDSWFLETIPAMLKHLANYGSAYPGHPPFETMKEWHDWLEQMALNLENCKEENIEKNNEFNQAYFEQIEEQQRFRTDENGNVIYFLDETENLKHLRNLYYARNEQLCSERKELIENTMNELGHNFFDLWD